VTYDYECTACLHTWQIEQKISECPVRDCPKCKQEAARRLISGSGAFVLNGKGWFKTGGY